MSVIPDHDSRREFTLAAIRTAVLRVRLIEHELTAAGSALKAGLIAPETALEWVEEAAPGCLSFIPDVVTAEGVAA